MAERVLVVVPTFNERENIREIIGDIVGLDLGVDVLIVDDESRDGTGDVADQVSLRYDNVDVMHRMGERGRGLAVAAGLKYGVDNMYDVVVEMDADGSHDPAELSRILSGLEGMDVAVGSRYVEGGVPVYHSWVRKLMSRLSNFFNRSILGLPFMDVTCDYRAYRLSALSGFDFDSIRSKGFVFGVELLYELWRGGYRIREVPVTFRERGRGKSKTDWRVVLKYPLEVLKLKKSKG